MVIFDTPFHVDSPSIRKSPGRNHSVLATRTVELSSYAYGRFGSWRIFILEKYQGLPSSPWAEIPLRIARLHQPATTVSAERRRRERRRHVPHASSSKYSWMWRSDVALLCGGSGWNLGEQIRLSQQSNCPWIVTIQYIQNIQRNF